MTACLRAFQISADMYDQQFGENKQTEVPRGACGVASFITGFTEHVKKRTVLIMVVHWSRIERVITSHKAVNRRPVTAEALVRSQARPCGICGG